MMRTTSLIVEFLVAGIMVSLALVVFVYTVLSGEMQAISDLLSPFKSQYGKAALVVIFVAVAYSLGILSELIGRISFEWLLDIVKHNYLKEYLRELENEKVIRGELPILKTLGNVSPEDVTKKQAVKCIGPMRFLVMRKSTRLYQDIELQLHEYRLMRILFIVEAILVFVVFYRLYLKPDLSLWGVLLILIAMAHITFYAIYDRFKRYCRSIGRAYRALVVDKEQSTSVAEPAVHADTKIKIKRANTEIAHQQYSTPLVGIIIFLSKKGKIALFKQQDKWKLPEEFARGDEDLNQAVRRILSEYLVNSNEIKIESYTLLSREGYRTDAYQYNYIAFVQMIEVEIKTGEKIKWISEQDLESIDSICSAHKTLLEKYFRESCLEDKVTIPADLSNREESEPALLKETRKIHAQYARQFPMPQITVDGLLLKFKNCTFEGVILEKRSPNADREPGKWALPGGFVNAHETVSEALAYEVFEEVGITLEKDNFLSMRKHKTGPDRDPVYFVWTCVMVAYTREEPEVRSNEISEVKVFPLSTLPWDEMAFDHDDILKECMDSLSLCVLEVLEKCRSIR